ncbi:hypothetical protein L207DRAFT_639404 [Hyaloscypha variabilis F]|uniref:Uncharacterized protein n=1 Tax=Hyaloscypha variabilis (strain UAMH 11265 / GT02V1 / F) TaxID=1149755 RepID=A0A2J6R3Z2_HYAVF|nr:hypothetical protein L207DRAFT_639404 [Hyaloscypha variabilis F]
MQLTTPLITTLLSLISTTTAAALPQTTVTPGATTPWDVSNFVLGCSPGGCTYTFDISGPATADVGPTFSTSCSGSDEQQKMVPCSDTNIESNLVPTQDVGLVLQVSRFGDGANGGDNGYMYGNATAAPEGEGAFASFVVPAEFYGDIVY